MTPKEAIEHLKLITDNEAYSDYFQDVCRTAIEALEKQVPKKPKIRVMQDDLTIGCGTFRAGTNTRWCRICNKPITVDPYCRWCGQRINWE